MKNFVLGLLLMSCSPAKEESHYNPGFEPGEEYVLIEFASKLEEEYHQIHDKPESPSPK